MVLDLLKQKHPWLKAFIILHEFRGKKKMSQVGTKKSWLKAPSCREKKGLNNGFKSSPRWLQVSQRIFCPTFFLTRKLNTFISGRVFAKLDFVFRPKRHLWWRGRWAKKPRLDTIFLSHNFSALLSIRKPFFYPVHFPSLVCSSF